MTTHQFVGGSAFEGGSALWEGSELKGTRDRPGGSQKGARRVGRVEKKRPNMSQVP